MRKRVEERVRQRQEEERQEFLSQEKEEKMKRGQEEDKAGLRQKSAIVSGHIQKEKTEDIQEAPSGEREALLAPAVAEVHRSGVRSQESGRERRSQGSERS